MSGQLISPFSCDITPERALPLAGYRRREGLSAHVEVPLEANGILFDTATGPAAVIAIDTLFAGDALTDAVAQAWDGDMPQLLWLASHTHGAPSLDPTKPRLGAVDAAYLAESGARIARAMAQAKPVTAATRRSGTTRADGAVWRRRRAWRIRRRPPFLSHGVDLLPDASVDIPRDLILHVLEDAAATPLAVIWSWPCHPLTTGDLSAISSDFPGLVREHLRRTFGEIPVIYAPGFCGDLRPAITTRGFSARSAARFPAHLGVLPIFRRPDAAAQSALVRTLTTAMDRLDRPSAPVDAPASIKTINMPAPNLISEATGSSDVPLTLCRLAGVEILGVGAEVSALHHAPLAAMLPGAILTGCAGQTLGYMPADQQLPEGGYEVTGFREGFSLSGKWEPGIDAALRDGVEALCH